MPLEGTSLDDVLALDVEAILSRRLQTMTFLKGLAFTPRQARQFIVHGHVSVGGRRVTIPGVLVSRTDENVITYDERSAISTGGGGRGGKRRRRGTGTRGAEAR